ncbi:hypothetical protein RhiirA5_440718 [Rhizophagus irregularis]|uniref:Protein kinase domain-containing protein n=1 Tax=Rhizophagus irregularis TaxID=588596 RepID=A0A2N0QP83_9GLOM|nr:hypothetical protein RhiirA5_440718 [Rhizophagus irregularis]PKC52863.1 hypothetical protein RhiirA1_480512 [Rhizophagus irregularis]
MVRQGLHCNDFGKKSKIIRNFSGDYILVMQYASGGDLLRQYLQDNFWKRLLELSEGEENENSKYNITQNMMDYVMYFLIPSLSYSKKFYGIIPYITPEILSNIGNDDNIY